MSQINDSWDIINKNESKKLNKKLFDKIDSLESKIDNYEGKIDSLESKIDNYEGKIDSLESTINSLKDLIKELKNKNEPFPIIPSIIHRSDVNRLNNFTWRNQYITTPNLSTQVFNSFLDNID